MSPRPPEPADDAPLPRVSVARDPDRVTVTIKVTDKMNDVFVSTEVGYSSSMLPSDKSPRDLYRRVAAEVNGMYAERRAEVRAALGRKVPTDPALTKRR
jgi:hypothetical protein